MARTISAFAALFLSFSLAGSSAALAQQEIKPGQKIRVLWDVSHGIYNLHEGDFDPLEGKYRELLGRLGRNGFSFDFAACGEHQYKLHAVACGIKNVDLSQYRIIITSVTSTFDSPYTKEEGDIIEKFVNMCGGLFVMTDNPGWMNQYIPGYMDQVLNRFGIYTGGTYIGARAESDIHIPVPSNARTGILRGVRSIYFNNGGDLLVKGTAKSEFALNGYTIIASSAEQRVIAVGDANFVDDDNTIDSNDTLILNAFQEIAAQAPGRNHCGTSQVVGD